MKKKYAEYRKGRELRFLVDELLVAQDQLLMAQRLTAAAGIEIGRIARVAAAMATQLRQES